MAQSQPDKGGLQPFCGWYKQVMCNLTKTDGATTI